MFRTTEILALEIETTETGRLPGPGFHWMSMERTRSGPFNRRLLMPSKLLAAWALWPTTTVPGTRVVLFSYWDRDNLSVVRIGQPLYACALIST